MKKRNITKNSIIKTFRFAVLGVVLAFFIACDVTSTKPLLSFKITPSDATLELRADTATGSVVYKGNNKVFNSLPSGTYYYIVSKDGYKDGTGNITILNLDDNIELVVILEKM